MTTQDLNTAKNRLERTNQEVLWVLNILDEPDTYMKEYNLSTDEKKELFLESQRKVAGLQMAIAQLHSKETSIQVGNKTVKRIGVIPPWPDEELAGVIPAWSDEERIVGRIPPDKDGEDKSALPGESATQ